MEGVPWILVAMGTLLIVLCTASSVNYSSVVFARATVYALPSYVTHISGLEPDGSLSEGGSVSVTVRITVENPSARALRLTMVTYSGWMEDTPAEVGLAWGRQLTDDRLVDPSGTRYFLRVFGQSRETQGAVPPRANASVEVEFTLDRSLDPARFEAVRNITAYAARAKGPGASITWNHWIRVEMRIEGVPDASSLGGASYLRALPEQNLGRIDREVGTNLAA